MIYHFGSIVMDIMDRQQSTIKSTCEIILIMNILLQDFIIKKLCVFDMSKYKIHYHYRYRYRFRYES